MAKKRKNSQKRERRIVVRSVRRDPPDIDKLSKAIISIAMSEAKRGTQANEDKPTENPTESHESSNQATDDLEN